MKCPTDKIFDGTKCAFVPAKGTKAHLKCACKAKGTKAHFKHILMQKTCGQRSGMAA